MGPKKKSVWENLREKTKTQFNNIKKKTTPGKLDEKKPKPLHHRRSMSVPDLRFVQEAESSAVESAFPTASDAILFGSSSGSRDNTSFISVPLFMDGLTATDAGPSGRKTVYDLAFKDNMNVSPGPIQKYLLTINLKEGRNLVIRDRHGTSDPYVKFKLEGKTFYKSKVVHKNLNPKWSESFSFPLQDWEQVVDVRVYDKDRTTDEFMGSSTIVIKNLELDKTSEMVLSLEDPSSLEDDMGVIVIDTCLTFRDATIKRPNQKGDQPQDKDQTQGSAEATNMSQLWSGVFGITLLEGQDMPEYSQGDIYVRNRLGEQKYKSKNLRIQANPRWREKFDFNKYENCLEPLNVEVFVKRGRKSEESWGMLVDLSKLPVNTQQLYTQALDPGKGRLILLATFNPCSDVSISDINKPPLEQPDERDQILEKYVSIFREILLLIHVGFLQVKVFNATDLTSTDLNGKSDPFCVLELGNSRLQTHTIYKTLSPEWNKVFTFPVKDIHDVLELKVFDEDGDKAPDFLGRVAIPLLSNGQPVTRGLKNENLRGPAKGTISLVMEVHYNPVRAGIKTFKPKEEKFMEDNRKFSKKVLAQNIYRVRKITLAVLHTLQYIKSCFQWESTQRSIIAFLTFMLMVWTWELFMMPIFLLLLIGWNYFQVTPGRVSSNQDLVSVSSYCTEEDEKESGKKGLMEKIHMVQEIIITVQNILDEIACIGERVKNTFNWSVPFLSCLACLVLFVATAALYYIPLRYIIFIWGINKFTKKLRNPYAIDNNEILDFIKRVPSDVQKVRVQFSIQTEGIP
uniref:C2 domain-containing protein n=1 Tax=Oncorhynchus tshawytscha TaxID=74940 RepID=A0A8C8J760_ONCTS